MSGDLDPFAAVRDAVVVVCEVSPDGLSAATSFDDLGADSLARVSIADTVEAALDCPGFRIDDAVLGRMATLSDLVEYLDEHLPAMSSAQ